MSARAGIAASAGKTPRRILMGEPVNWRLWADDSTDGSRYAVTYADFAAADFAQFDAIVPLTFDNYRHLEKIPELRGRKYFCPDKTVVSLCDDKLFFARYLEAQGFGQNLPRLRKPGPPYPYVWKRRIGTWGEHCRVVRGPEDESAVDPADSAWFAQDVVSGRNEFATHMLRVGGRLRYAATVRYDMPADEAILGAWAAPLKRHVSSGSAHMALFSNILALLGYEGTACFDYKVKNGIPRIFELNPRAGFSLATDLTRYLDAYLGALAP